MTFSFGKPDYLRQPPAYFHPRILVGPGGFLTRHFVHDRRITHVINCALDDDSPLWWRTSYPNKYAVMNAIDNPRMNIMDWYRHFECTLRRFLTEDNGVIYVHCQAGINRSASLSLAYCCDHFSSIPEALMESTLRQRPCMFTNRVFTNQVKEFINGRVQSEKDARHHQESKRNGDA